MKKYLEVVVSGSKSAGQIMAVHPRHDHVGDEQMDRSRVGFSQLQGLLRSQSIQHIIVDPGQNPFDEIQDRRFILDNQHSFAMPPGDDLSLRFLFVRHRIGMPRQINVEAGAATWFAVNVDQAVILFDDSVYRG